MTEQKQQHCGLVAVIGAPNAGKSTLVNALVGQKVAITSAKAQTTRARLMGIALADETQIILADTPGIFEPKRRLDRAMVAAAWDGAQEADAILLVVDGRKFLFPRASCTVVKSERQPSQTRVTLSCEGDSGSAGNRVIDLQTRSDGTLRVTEDSLTLTYFLCMKAPASTDSLVGQTM